ncbi:MAG: methylated-DNA--[protein]-cysteine S-methyltransferase [Brevinema sp.]
MDQQNLNQNPPMKYYFSYFESPFGLFLLEADQDFLYRLSFVNIKTKKESPNSILAETKKQLNEYFFKHRTIFDLPLRYNGTIFQQKVWGSLRNIPYGEIRSYKDIAENISSPKAYRAVGSANNKNPIPIIIPCHRVITSSGDFCGYNGGMDKKKWLLNHEQSLFYLN